MSALIIKGVMQIVFANRRNDFAPEPWTNEADKILRFLVRFLATVSVVGCDELPNNDVERISARFCRAACFAPLALWPLTQSKLKGAGCAAETSLKTA